MRAMNSHTSPDALIDALGGTTEVARLCDVEPQAVSMWRHRGIPKARMMFLRLCRPDVFSELDRNQREAA